MRLIMCHPYSEALLHLPLKKRYEEIIASGMELPVWPGILALDIVECRTWAIFPLMKAMHTCGWKNYVITTMTLASFCKS